MAPSDWRATKSAWAAWAASGYACAFFDGRTRRLDREDDRVDESAEEVVRKLGLGGEVGQERADEGIGGDACLGEFGKGAQAAGGEWGAYPQPAADLVIGGGHGDADLGAGQAGSRRLCSGIFASSSRASSTAFFFTYR
ncbi:hypothetical protein [Streptomyces canus]|uniref:hypothetical protein n=1 Tax=Streptomyces canus TaxID=58343 RepID=UPI0027D8BF02|nr:hypothetical protein [Streptomyces canus]